LVIFLLCSSSSFQRRSITLPDSLLPLPTELHDLRAAPTRIDPPCPATCTRRAAQLGYKHPDRRQHRTSLDPIFELRASKFQDQLILLFYFRRGFSLECLVVSSNSIKDRGK
jgi:hypothetical protein